MVLLVKNLSNKTCFMSHWFLAPKTPTSTLPLALLISHDINQRKSWSKSLRVFVEAQETHTIKDKLSHCSYKYPAIWPGFVHVPDHSAVLKDKLCYSKSDLKFGNSSLSSLLHFAWHQPKKAMHFAHPTTFQHILLDTYKSKLWTWQYHQNAAGSGCWTYRMLG